MTRSRSRSRSRTGARSDNSFTSATRATDSQSWCRNSSQLRESAAFIVLRVSMGAYMTPRSIYLRNDPSTRILDIKVKIYDEIERIPLKHQQLFFLDPTRIAGEESAIVPIEQLDFREPLALYGISDGAEIRCEKWCKWCCKTLCHCGEQFKWRDDLYSGSRLMLDDLDDLSSGDEDILYDRNFPQ